MTWLALVLFTPWFAILAWAYWAFPRDLPKTAARRAFDAVSISVAFIASTALLYAFYVANAGNGGAIWQQVIASLGAYAGFLALLLFAFIVRARLWPRANALPTGGTPPSGQTVHQRGSGSDQP